MCFAKLIFTPKLQTACMNVALAVVHVCIHVHVHMSERGGLRLKFKSNLRQTLIGSKVFIEMGTVLYTCT